MQRTVPGVSAKGQEEGFMLVRGKRIDNIIGEVVVVSEAVRIPNYIVAPAICIPLLFIILLIMLIYYRRLGPRKTEAELLDEMRKK